MTVRIMLVAAALAAAAEAQPRSTPGEPFIITFWCGPPLHLFDDARAAEIAAAGFTVVGAPCEGLMSPQANRHALGIARRHGLRMWINDPRLGVSIGTSVPRDVVRTVVADYRDQEALEAYFVVDEPPAQDFAAVGALVEALHAQDPDRFAYVNLLPDYISPLHLGAPSYEDYVERFIITARPRLLSYDHYPFRSKEDRPSFFQNLSIVRAAAQRHGIPFMLIVLAMPHGPYRDPTEAEIAWQIFHALAFGARGVSYFAYWTPADVPHADQQRFRAGLIDRGQPTRHYFEAQRLNRVVGALGAALSGFDSLGVSDSTGRLAIPFREGPVEAISGGAVTMGWFRDDAGRLALLLVNRDYRARAALSVRLRAGTPLPEVFDHDTGSWSLGLPQPLVLGPGRPRLLRWSKPARDGTGPLLSDAFLIENGAGSTARVDQDG